MKYELNTESSIPIYQQLADMIAADIKCGKLTSGAKLPTVRDFAEELGVAKGTVKRTYEELRNMGVVDMTQGRGTFVRYQPMNSKSRKERAMAAIDKMLQTLKGLDISPSEIQIFVELRMREYLQCGEGIKLGFVECSPEILAQISDRLRDFDEVDVYPFILEEVLSYPYKIGDDMDLVITSEAHAKQLEKALPSGKNIMKVALAMRPQSLKNIAQLSPELNVGIACKSERFCTLIKEVCKNFSATKPSEKAFFFGEDDFAKYLSDKDALLLPSNYENFCSIRETELIEKFSARHILVKCSYQTDQGSMIALDERIKAIKEKKKL